MKNIFVPTSGPDDWRGLLADMEKHWRPRFSAYTLAHCWEKANGFPLGIAAVLNQSPDLEGIEPLLIFPEWKVPLPGGIRPSQNDVWVLAKCKKGLVSITVEGKVEEPFGPTVLDWKNNASTGKEKRLDYLKDVLGFQKPIPDDIYYQLVHRAASAVIEAERFGADQAVMLVHSFSSENKWFNEFVAFAALFGMCAEIGKLVSGRAGKGMILHLGWVHGDERYLKEQGEE